VAGAHLELFGDIGEVALAKRELVENLPASGTAILNADDPLVAEMQDHTLASVLKFGRFNQCEVMASEVELDDQARARFKLSSPWGHTTVILGFNGDHQVMNALAAAAAAMACGVTPDEVAAGLAAAKPSPLRMDVHRTRGGAWVVDDSYNANPTSMEAAFKALTHLGSRRRIAVLGTMAELGKSSEAEHRRIAVLAGDLGIEVVSVAENAYGVATIGPEEVVGVIGPLGPGDAVLVKASRVAALESVAEAIRRAAR
jgi:UDP-N-acetylmuramoyl-tripeptide--D-alanyl-D-alanine ligase